MHNWYHHRTAQQRGFQVGRHIVRAFVVMLVFRVVFGYCFAEIHFKILAYGWIGVLVDREGGGCMPYEHLAHTGFNIAELRQHMHHFVCNEMKAPAFLLKSYAVLMYFHGSKNKALKV